ncbi:unnamed protein product [Lupinus luteus]|uniref:Uncharacterized protein n=1 Tax=Lupinus luteus TaxID=3873 RepID=A0AAV1Y4F2_LUPLU
MRSNSNRSRRNVDDEEEENGVGANSDDLHLFSHVLPSSSSSSSSIANILLQDPASAAGGGKHDYDWLLTPPGTPLFPSSTSKLSISHSDNIIHNHNHSRSSTTTSLTRHSHSHNNNNNTYSSTRLSSSSILNTSSSSVSSYIRPSSPISRSLSRPSTPSKPRSPASRPTPTPRPAPSQPSRPSTPTPRPAPSQPSRPSTPTSRPAPSQPSRPSTPTSRPAPSQPSRPAPFQPSRPATPTSRPAPSHPSSAPPTRSLSRPSTPTRRNSTPSPSPTQISSTSPARLPLNARNSSRPSSPTPRPRPTPHPIVPSDFPQHTPPNLRTTLPNRPLSAGRSRPTATAAATLKTNSETQPSSANNISRRHSSPIVNRGRFTEPPAPKTRGYANSNAHHVDLHEPRKLSHAPETGARRSVKSSTTTTTVTDNTGGFGRTISKKSLDMAIKHMDIRNSSGNLRALSNTTLFPQSIRTSTTPSPKSQSHRVSSAPASINMNGSLVSSNNRVATFDVRNNINRNTMINGREVLDERQHNSAKLSEVVDIYESSRYDALLLKEDLKNTDWLHSADDKCDQDSIFGNGFEHLPEPFGLL